MEDGFLQEIERLNNLLKLKVMESQEWQEQVNKSGETLKEEYDNLQLVYQQTLKECEGYKRRVSELEERYTCCHSGSSGSTMNSTGSTRSSAD